MIPFGAAHTYMAYIWEYPPPPPPLPGLDKCQKRSDLHHATLHYTSISSLITNLIPRLFHLPAWDEREQGWLKSLHQFTRAPRKEAQKGKGTLWSSIHYVSIILTVHMSLWPTLAWMLMDSDHDDMLFHHAVNDFGPDEVDDHFTD